MKGLLKKDWYMTLKYGRSLFGLLLLYAVIAAFSSADMMVFWVIFDALIASMLVKTLMAYEEQSKWDSMAINLPVTPGQIVLSKYLVGIISIVVAGGGMMAVMVLVKAFANRLDGFPIFTAFLMMLCIGFLMLSMEMPVLFKFGVAQGRIWMLLLTVIAAVIGGVLGTLVLGNTGEIGGVNLTELSLPLTLGLLAVTAILLYLSVGLSVRFYKKREF